MQQQRPSDGMVPLTVGEAKQEVAGTVFGGASCPHQVELRFTPDGQLGWSDDATRHGVLAPVAAD
ncbi:hypothetical protein [Kitasatospora albolonga]|uniref:hypothetical protein n=1 Tax=Kitasatospora albolonga TaxID=68173 RepID=UPI0035F0ACC2